MAGLTWLHLSDWHQKGDDFDRDVVRDKLIEDIKNRSKIHTNLEKVDFIVFSGDIAFKGKKEEFQAAEKHLFQPVLEATGLGKDRLFIVPGNHDLDRDQFKYLPPELRKPITKDAEIKECLSDKKMRSRILEPFEAYEEFVKPYANGTLSAYASTYEITVGDKQVKLLGFNSALMCGRNEDKEGEVDDYGKIILGEPQIHGPLQGASEAAVRIAIMHHPFECLTESDRITVEKRLKKDVHFILFGHQHRTVIKAEKGTEGDCILIPAGSAYNRRNEGDSRYANAYNLVHLDFEMSTGIAYLRQWKEDDQGWRAHIKDEHRDGTFTFVLPKALNKKKEDPEPITVSPEKEIEKVSPPLVGTYSLDNPVFNVPYRAKKEGLVGRDEALEKVRKQLTAGKRTAIGHTAAFQGLGGLGKTQLAVEYAHQYRGDYPEGVIWINADQEIDAQLIHMAKQAKWAAPESKHSDILEMAVQRLKTRSNCLIIFDNVEDGKAIDPYLPEVDAVPHLLLTSRTPQPGFFPIEIDLLDDNLSLNLLLKEACRDLESLPEEEQTAAREIAVSLGGLPLAIEIAGAYLCHIPGCTFKQYKAILAENLKKAMDGTLLSSFTNHERNLYLTLQVSQPVFTQAPELEEILDLLAWSASSFMGLSLMAAVLDKKEADLHHALSLGASLRLLKKSPEGERYDIHRLVRHVRQEQYPINGRQHRVEDVCLRLGDWFEKRRKQFTDLPVYEAEIDHLNEWLKHVKPYASIHVSRLTWLQAYPPFHWGRYQEAHHLVQVALALFEETSSSDQKLKANILNDIGTTFGELGDFKKSLDYQEQALEIRREIFGEQHEDTAASLNNVGSTYNDLGNPKEALKYHEQALDIYRKRFGEMHPDTARAFNNVGNTYSDLGKHEEALKYRERALDIYRKRFGELHPDTATSINNVGSTYAYLENHQKALEFQEHALDIRKKLFGEMHPDIAQSLNNVGSTYDNLKQHKEAINSDFKQHKEALKYKEQALTIFQQIYGEQHPHTAAAYHNTGYTHHKLGNYLKSIEYFQKAFKIRVQLLGENHQRTVDSFSNIIVCLIKLRKFQEASERLNDFLEHLPRDHPKYAELASLKKLIHKGKIKVKSAFPSKKKKKR